MCNCGSGWIRTHSSLRLSEPKAKTPPYISTPSDILGTKCWAHLDANQGPSPYIRKNNLAHVSYFSGGARDRTWDLLFIRQMLLPLSYTPMSKIISALASLA